MPVIAESSYEPPFWFKFRHINTIYPAFFRTFPGFEYKRERMNTPDGDFLDLDWSKKDSDQLIIVLHGLEGSAARSYVKGLIHYFNHNGWDGLGVNHRSCSGELNTLLRSYHMGVSDDLEAVVDHICRNYNYKTIVIAGFSLGGNVLLKYFGEQGKDVPAQIKAAVAISVPCHIETANTEIAKWFNRHYVMRFIRTLNRKMKQKALRFPDKLDVSNPMPRNFSEFDDRFTSKLHGFRDAVDYWRKCSSFRFLPTFASPSY
jgi:predicted alpha/beta-fold hydrolase